MGAKPSKTAIAGIAALLFGLWPGLAAAQQAIPIASNSFFDWDAEQNGAVFTHGQMSMTLLLYGGDGVDWIEGAALILSGADFEGLKLKTVAGMSGFGELGIFTLDSEGGQSILFASYTGGAHCCMDAVSAWLGPDGPVIAHVGTFDGGALPVEDLDGDGLYEIVVRDDRFNYTFDAYAFSYPPVLILKSENGRIVDASNDPAFRPMIEEEFERYSSYCGGENGFIAGACAGLLADAVRLGRYEQTRAMISEMLAGGQTFESSWESFSFCTDSECDNQVEYDDFLEAVDYALERWGYL